MSKPQWARVEKGIYKTKNKDGNVRYQVRVAPETNSRKEVKRTVDTMDGARVLVREAARIRKEGKNVRDVWDAEKGRDGKPRTRVPIEKFFEEYLADCDRRLSIGSKKSPSKGGAGTGLRPSTVTGYKSRCRTMAEHLKELSVDFLDELTPEKCRELRDAMRDAGLAEKTQGDYLSQLWVMIDSRKESEFPLDFPHEHEKIKAVPPGDPLTKPDDPDQWGGTEFEKFPALPLLDAFRLAEDLEPPRRLVIYLAALMGMRVGEIFGLQLDAISYKGNRVWLNIKRTRSADQLKVQDWVKTESSNRQLPVPAVLQDALVGYCTEFHDWDPLSGSKPQNPNALLITGSNGIPETLTNFNKARRRALKRTKLTKKDLGGQVTLQHLRRTCLSYIQNAGELTSVLAEEVNPDEDGPDAFQAYGTTEGRFIKLGMRVSPKSASKWAGHMERGESSDREAAAVTRTNYNRRVLRGDRLSDVADWLSLMVKLEKRAELIEAGEEPDWSVPVAKKEQFLTDGDEDWVSIRRFAVENELDYQQFWNQFTKGGWFQARFGDVPTLEVLPLEPVPGPTLRIAIQLEHLEMVRTYMATVTFVELCVRLGFGCVEGISANSSEHIRASRVTDYMVEQELVTPAEDPYSHNFWHFHPEEADRAYQALVVKPFLEQLQRGGAQPAATLGLKLKAEPIFRTRTGLSERRRPDRNKQVQRCLEGLEADGLVEKLRNGSWKITDEGRAHLEGDSNE